MTATRSFSASSVTEFDGLSLLQEQTNFLSSSTAADINTTTYLKVKLAAQQKRTAQRNHYDHHPHPDFPASHASTGRDRDCSGVAGVAPLLRNSSSTEEAPLTLEESGRRKAEGEKDGYANANEGSSHSITGRSLSSSATGAPPPFPPFSDGNNSRRVKNISSAAGAGGEEGAMSSTVQGRRESTEVIMVMPEEEDGKEMESRSCSTTHLPYSVFPPSVMPSKSTRLDNGGGNSNSVHMVHSGDPSGVESGKILRGIPQRSPPLSHPPPPPPPSSAAFSSAYIGEMEVASSRMAAAAEQRERQLMEGTPSLRPSSSMLDYANMPAVSSRRVIPDVREEGGGGRGGSRIHPSGPSSSSNSVPYSQASSALTVGGEHSLSSTSSSIFNPSNSGGSYPPSSLAPFREHGSEDEDEGSKRRRAMMSTRRNEEQQHEQGLDERRGKTRQGSAGPGSGLLPLPPPLPLPGSAAANRSTAPLSSQLERSTSSLSSSSLPSGQDVPHMQGRGGGEGSGHDAYNSRSGSIASGSSQPGEGGAVLPPHHHHAVSSTNRIDGNPVPPPSQRRMDPNLLSRRASSQSNSSSAGGATAAVMRSGSPSTFPPQRWKVPGVDEPSGHEIKKEEHSPKVVSVDVHDPPFPLPLDAVPAVASGWTQHHAGPEVVEVTLVPCVYCGRRFAEDRIERHATACEKQKKIHSVRQRNNTNNNRGGGGGQASQRGRQIPSVYNLSPGAREEYPPSRAEDYYPSEVFTSSRGGLVEDNRVECAYCHRRFAADTAARHAPLCKERLNKKAHHVAN